MIKFYFEVNGKQPEALQSSDQQKTEVLEISETVPEVVPELVTPVVTGPVTELVTTTETEEKLDEMVLQNGAIEIEEKEVIEESEEVTEVEKIEDVKEIEPEEIKQDEEQHEEQKGTFEFNVPDIDDDSNGKKTSKCYVISTYFVIVVLIRSFCF